MRRITTRGRGVCALVLLPFLLLAACMDGTPPTPSVAPQEVLTTAATTMAALKSFHFNLTTSKVPKAPSSLYVTTADGDVARPGKLKATAGALLAGVPVEVQVLVSGDAQYMTDPLSKRWQKIPASFNALALLDPGKAIGDILTGVQQPVHDGSETLAGAPCTRIKGQVLPAAMRALSPEITASDPLSVTIWIGSADSRVRQAQITGVLITGELATVVRTLTFSQYDTPVDIALPPGITP